MSSPGKWIILLVAFDDDDVEPQVLKERIEADEDEHLAALLRGAELITVLGDDEEEVAEAIRLEMEKQCLR
jgi:hypothetical protein